MPSTVKPDPASLPFLQGGGEMGVLIRAIDWADTQLGTPADWPIALKLAAGNMLTSSFPTLICWGSDYIQLYNDAFRPINGESKHPQALGGSATATYAEIWDIIGPMFAGVMQGGKFGFPDFKVLLDRNGYIEDCYFNFSYSPIRDEDGKIGGVLVVCIETTAQVRAFNQLAAAQEELAAINEELTATNEELTASNEESVATNEKLSDTFKVLEQSRNDLLFTIKAAGLGTFDYDPTTNRFSGNDVLKSWFGLSADEEIELSLATDVIAEGDRERVINAIQYALDYQSEGKYDIEYVIANPKNPRPRLVHAKGRTEFSPAKQPVRLSGTLQDITEEKKSLTALEEAREQFSLIADNIAQLAWMTDETGYIYWYNQRWYDYTGTTLEEMKGWGWNKVHHPEHIAPVLEKWTANIQSGEIFEMTFPLKSKEGEFRWFLTRAVPLKNENGEVLRWFGTNTDITEQKQDEQRKNDFIGMVSHELKTPLTSLTAIIQVANAKLKNGPDTFLAGAMEKANKQVKKMTTMINGFLNISRLESGKILVDKKMFNLEELIGEMIGEAEIAMTSHQIRFEPCKPVDIYADQDKIASVISNLISNAVKYSPKGKFIDITCEATGKNVQVSIRDEGIGIKPEDQQMLFERYYRVENDQTPHVSGFGIGLYLSAEIIRRHDGKIGVKSEIGKGSTFYFSLPLNRK